ncbi:hypothetical protein Tsubulata_033468, partial [Turnera subulata]
YLREPEALSLPPPDGPNSGVLVIQTFCWGPVTKSGLPFPQNMNLKVQYSTGDGDEINRVHFIPVLNKPLSSNQYYVIERGKKHKGEAHISSTEEEDMKTCCLCSYIGTRKPQPLDPNSLYQQFEIHRRPRGVGFVAKSVAPDGFPPDFLRRKGWVVYTSTPREFQLTEASGLNRELRACLPDFNFKLSEQSSGSAIVVGKWYCPFMFVKERTLLKDQMESSIYYEMTLEQQWVQIFYCENKYNESNAVNVDVVVKSEVATVGGRRVTQKQVVDGVMWFRSGNDVGLSLAIIERIKWEEENFGWVAGGTDKEERSVMLIEEFAGIGGWRKFGCYVLVERAKRWEQTNICMSQLYSLKEVNSVDVDVVVQRIVVSVYGKEKALVSEKNNYVSDGMIWFRRFSNVSAKEWVWGLNLGIIERLSWEQEIKGRMDWWGKRNKEPEALSFPPPDGPNSGVLVIQDEAAEPTFCWGLVMKSDPARALPLPQNKNLKVQYNTGDSVEINRLHFIPVLNKPLSSNQYYVIERGKKHKGGAHISSTQEEDMKTCCFCSYVSTRKPQPLDPNSLYQQFEIHRRRQGVGYFAKSVAPDGFPPNFLRRKGWVVSTSTPREFHLTEASGLNRKLRACLPDFNFKLSEQSSGSAIVVGKWYCPFMFVKEGTLLTDQMESSIYYEMTLEQQWVQIFFCENKYNESNVVNVDVVVESEVVTVDGTRVTQKQVVDGVMWFKSGNDVGLSLAIIERIKWEEENFGWVTAGGTDMEELRVKRMEEFGGIGGWRKFGYYVLVERFVLKRMDGSLVLTHEFRHTSQIRSKWE